MFSAWKGLKPQKSGEYSYVATSNKLTWAKAREHCQSLGGDLAHRGVIRGCVDPPTCNGATGRR